MRISQSWQPISLRYGDNGHLWLANTDLHALAQDKGTPLYVLDLATLMARCQAYQQCFNAYPGKVQLVYASKALSCVGVLQLMHKLGFAVDVVSGGELLTAFKAGLPGEKIVFHGNNKSRAELLDALMAGTGRIVIDSLDELTRLESLVHDTGLPAEVLLRVVPGIEAHTHEHIKTGQRDTKFGIPSEQVLEAVRRVLKQPRIRFCGLHAHVGSQIFDAEPLAQCAEVLLDLAAHIETQTGTWIDDLNIGGGLGIAYTDSDHPVALEQVAERLIISIQNKCSQLKKPLPRLMLEPGRSLVATAGLTLYSVGTLKEILGVRSIAAVDGGMADNPRPITYGAKYTVDCVNKATEDLTHKYRVVGKFCESGDILLKEAQLPKLDIGDVLVVYATGAYNYSMASNYNRVPRPAMVLVTADQVLDLVARETAEDLLRHDQHLPPDLLK